MRETSLQNNSKIEFISIHHLYSLRTWQFWKRARACKAAVKSSDEWVKETWSSSPVCACSLTPSGKEAIILLNLESSYRFQQQVIYLCMRSQLRTKFMWINILKVDNKTGKTKFRCVLYWKILSKYTYNIQNTINISTHLWKYFSQFFKTFGEIEIVF